MNEMTIKFNEIDYIAKYNEQTGYYELDLTAPTKGGIYQAEISFTDLFNENYKETTPIQILAKEKIKLETNKVFMWIFDGGDFTVRDIVELSNYNIKIDEETNANSIIDVLKKTSAKSDDIIAIKKNNEIKYWGIIDNIQNENGKILYEYILKYITNLFNEKIELKQNKKITKEVINNSIYKIKLKLNTNKELAVKNASQSNSASIVVYDNGNTDNQKWVIKKEGTYYKIKALHSNKFLTADGKTLYQYEETNEDNQKWIIEKHEGYYVIKSKLNELCIDIPNSQTTNDTQVELFNYHNSDNEQFILEEIEEEVIKKIGVEDFIAKAIDENFISNEDTFLNKEYLRIVVKTHTKKQTSVSNVEDGIYNLHTWMTNCTQNYDIVYSFSIENKKLVMTIENKTYNKILIDTKAQAISNYSEVFETKIISKVVVLTSTDTYILYLLNDRTTTTDMNNPNRAKGKTETVYTEKYEDAPQKALDTIKANSYNHNIAFKMLGDFIKVGTPIAIKTKESLIYDTYISAISITQNKFVDYTCGNIRTGFIEKLSKERKS